MSDLPDLAGSAWLSAPDMRRVFDLLADDGGGGARIVGGAVRDALLNRDVGDVDFATPLRPDEVIARAEKAGINVIPTGIEHGTVTLVVDGKPFEVTTLREDVETDGRRAIVRFGQDWTADARRRDFTMNALSIDADGRVFDPLGGYDDLVAGRVRFIGDPDQRIAEDRLRLLRLFRFQASHGREPIADPDLAAAIRARDGIRDLSRERVGAEMRRLLAADAAAETAWLMQDCGVLPVVLGGVGYVRDLARLVEFERVSGRSVEPTLRLAALGARVRDDVERLTERLRLSNAEKVRLLAGLAAAGAISPEADRSDLLRQLYRHGREAARDGVALGSARSGEHAPGNWAALDRFFANTDPPRFPLSGRHVTGLGVPAGPMVGRFLSELEAWWIGRGFAPDEGELMARLQQMVASTQ